MGYIADCPVGYAILSAPVDLVAEAGTRTISTVFAVDPANVAAFVEFTAGYDETIDTVVRHLPLRHPVLTNLFATRCRTRAYNLDGSPACGPPYDGVAIDVEFSMFPFPVSGTGGFYKKRLFQGGEYTAHPASGYAFPTDIAPGRDLDKYTPHLVYGIESYFEATNNETTILAKLGDVNDRTFLGHNTGHVRFDGCFTEDADDMGGPTVPVKIYVFTARRALWTDYEQPDGAAETPTNRSTSLPVRAASNLLDLIPNYE